jgi:hypothetical protein
MLPKKHHYIPVFYLKRWANPQGKVIEFSRPFGNQVKPQAKHPNATGYRERLYEMQGVPTEKAQDFEKNFMQPLDGLASQALALLENESNDWNSENRSAWSRFILSLLIRSPRDIESLKRQINGEILSESRSKDSLYKIHRSPSDPETFFEFFHEKESVDRFSLKIAASLMDHSRIIEIFNNMIWITIDTDQSDYPLLTSDHPVLGAFELKEHDAYIILPIGPNKVFCAVHNQETKRRIIENIRMLPRNVNKFVCRYAKNYVFESSDIQLSFIQKHMSTSPQLSVLERLEREKASKKEML